MSKLMRINDSTVEKIEELSKITGQTKQKIMDRAITIYSYEQMLKKANEQYAILKSDPQAWKEMQHEREAWDTTLMDGLKDDKS